MFYVLSQVVSDNPIDVASQIAPQLGVLGVLVWYLHHNVKYTIPNLNEQNSQTIKSIVSDHKLLVAEITERHRCTVAELTARFDHNLEAERKIRQQEIKDLAAAIQKMSEHGK